MNAAPAPAAPRGVDDLKLAAVWGVLAALAVVALMPYLAQTMPERFARLPVPLGLVMVLQALQTVVLIGAMAWLGLRMGHRVGLGSPVLRAWLVDHTPLDWTRLRPVPSTLLGLGAGLAIVALSPLSDRWLPPMAHPPAHVGAQASAINGALASFYGGIAEELQLRLFLMTLLVWGVARLRRDPPGAGVYWAAILLAALLFGAGHLPTAAQVWGLTPGVVARTLLLNGVGGIVFGWLYWRRGLEMAMLGHFCADLVLHVAMPLIGLVRP